MGAEGRDLRDEPFVRSLLEKLPAGARDSFSDEQLLALKVALGGRAWGVHAVDLRWTLKLWRWHYYFVLLAGRNRRDLSRREREIARIALALFLAGFVVLSTAFGLLVLYLAKSALGIDLLPGFSFGIWGWFQESFLR
ncbi:3-phosphoshikimate 1-carboxyvinyltransferase [Azonexus hydrophilus]|uniref:3-phosphoshikimate 1-carboxyvinyltransferase n=1 Tax=Azonexus hydrophilus TaxID=418702 RepID=A0A1R1I8L5_9RHOO|nr:3-phosphoshikimate 1-carboxyvinyltransferase [Azonexus hydrophilus]OMG55118.1 3-phosphoshikimate 1-carboxyvinyltransferase [Azonexus hydrophilus]